MTPGDRFLAVMSSARKMPTRGENGVFAAMDATMAGPRAEDGSPWHYWEWLHSMEELGFLRIEPGKVLLEPPWLVPSVEKAGRAHHSGARTPSWLDETEKLARHAGLSVRKDTYDPAFPTRIRFAGNERGLTRFAAAGALYLYRADVPAAYHYAMAAYPVSDVEWGWEFHDATLEGLGKDSLRFFNPRTLGYENELPVETGLVLGTRKRHGTHFNMYKVDGPGRVRVSPDVPPGYAKWYCLGKAGATLLYNFERRVVLVPRFCRLPVVLGRALCLCSCRAPVTEIAGRLGSLGGNFYSVDWDFLAYQEVPEVVARVVARKLGVGLQGFNYPEDKLKWKTL